MSKWFLNSNTPKSHALSLFIVVRTRQSEPQRELRPQMSASVGKKSPPVSLRGSFVSQVPKGFRIMHNIQPRLPKVMPCIVLEGGPEAASAGHSGKSVSSPLHPQEERLLVTGLTECTLISKIALKGLNALNRTGRTESQVAASTCRT
ncbi:hypothetical protein TGRUB_230130 [Toxoplasma gondii RUB]|uniref:Uncharacterized protein n=3 Tax=Toxoplasma gondii TaxID=5811 RepID=A0A086M3U1_TOXGO|nr:hypothetical protein TGRUB_230130 [Toxoplasma gondii RUB]KFH03128.1 hypothetical protein TGVAND_230130 [Toxoplasma gondii VAND]